MSSVIAYRQINQSYQYNDANNLGRCMSATFSPRMKTENTYHHRQMARQEVQPAAQPDVVLLNHIASASPDGMTASPGAAVDADIPATNSAACRVINSRGIDELFYRKLLLYIFSEWNSNASSTRESDELIIQMDSVLAWLTHHHKTIDTRKQPTKR